MTQEEKDIILKKVTVEVDMVKYCEVFGLPEERNRRIDYSCDYEPMSLTPHDIKYFLDKGISIKLIDYEWKVYKV